MPAQPLRGVGPSSGSKALGAAGPILDSLRGPAWPCFLQIGVSVGGRGAAGRWVLGAGPRSMLNEGLYVRTDRQDVPLYNPEGEKPSSAPSCLLTCCDIRVTGTFQFRNAVRYFSRGISPEL